MAEAYSVKRVFCAPYLGRYKKNITKQRNFCRVQDQDVNSLKKFLTQETSTNVKETNYPCQRCFQYYSREIHCLPATSETVDDVLMSQFEAFEQLHCYVLPSKVSPLKPPRQVASCQRELYGKRKQAKIEDAINADICSGIRTATARKVWHVQWMKAFRQVHRRCVSHQ